MNPIKYIIIIGMLIASGLMRTVTAQTLTAADSLTMQVVITRALECYPTVQQAQEAVQTAQMNRKMTESSYLPSLSGVASYTFIDPISKLDMNGKTIHIETKNNGNIGISLNQLIYDFGKTRSQIDAARLSEQLAGLQKEQVMQNLTLQAIQSYYLTAYARQSIHVKERQLEDYARLVSQTEVKRDAGAATNFDYLNTSSEYNAEIGRASCRERVYVLV